MSDKQEKTPDENTAAIQALAKKSIEKLDTVDSLAALEVILEERDSARALATFGALMHLFYWKRKDLDSALLFGKAGLQYGITVAKELKRDDKDSKEILAVTRGLAYDIASFTWVGWDEPGIQISDADQQTGLDAAKINLRLAVELEKEALPLSRAYWMLGGQYLAAQKFDHAREQFTQAKEKARAANVPSEELLSEGFLEVVSLVESKAGEENDQLKKILKRLIKLEHGEMFTAQISTALQVFATGQDNNK